MRAVGSTSLLTIPIDATVSFEGGITLCVPAEDTYSLAPGTYEFDVVADPYGVPKTVSQGTIEVEYVDRITPIEGNGPMIINYWTDTDYRRAVTWMDQYGAIIEVSDARLQARDGTNAVVLDLGFFELPPSEASIGSYAPEKRGYLSPLAGATLEIHISNQAVVTPGEFKFDLLGQDAATGDWTRVAEGVLVVSDTATSPPTV
jgi:hypothetical protein